ncbi:TetR/AcrR family transcriptional regulator [Gryllotalpicola ginsengisoli]|uniref:TetR/AcrR family transcriptional regulator n=1 Tax=Gryllotalpicola ginsengisoli TaxID=444608 RepID=UPI0003B47FAB|nr:TetR/AcrR family transcriptional regulator [Gryllotalpicola ginsengisoli]
MGRWEPDARGRLAQAALELFLERGYDATTVADIAARAGLTERTFFRQFSDKREVLFGDPAAYFATFTDAIASAPAAAKPLEALSAGLDAATAAFAGMHPYARLRQSVIDANAPLREREQIKRAHLVDELSEALRRRGVAESTARLTAELGAVAFHLAFQRWVQAEEELDLTALTREVLAELRAAAA